MDDSKQPPPDLPLQEAVARDLIPCSLCGARGADVREVRGKPHFLCARCGARSRRVGLLLAALCVVALAAGGWFVLRRAAGVDATREGAGGIEPWLKETLDLMGEKRYPEAMDRISQRLKAEPDHAGIHGLLGQCLWNLSRYEEALASFRKAAGLDPERGEAWGVWIGSSLQKLGWSAEALPQLQAPSALAPLERMRLESLLECLIDLERFDEALKMLDPDARAGAHLRARHRILSYQGKTDEARRLIEGLDSHQRGTLRASELREAGDFEAAFGEVEALRGGHEPPAVQWMLAVRSELSVCAEAGDLERLDRAASRLSKVSDLQFRNTAIFYGALGGLMAGKPDAAKEAAREFTASTDATYGPLRLERLMMRHLLGEVPTADIEAEAGRVSRFLANDLYWYLALATGDKAWARKAADATPGRNFPYHAIRRLLKE